MAKIDNSELRVLVLAPYPPRTVPSQRFRFEQYLAPLAQAGIRLTVSNFLSPSAMEILHRPGHWARKAHAVSCGVWHRLQDLRAARRYDLAMVHREAWPLAFPVVERLLQQLGLPYVFDFDDAIYLPNSSGANRRLSVLKHASKTASIVRHAALVLAGNDHLAAWARRHSNRVRVIPTTIDVTVYRPRDKDARTAPRLCVGWSGSLTTIDHLRTVTPVLRDLQRERDVALRVIGDPTFVIPGAKVDAIPWREATEVEDLREIDVGIMPLPDDEWARGKCGLKALQYMALGIPTVMSPVGVNCRIARGGAALLASSLSEWTASLRSLLDDPGLRERLGRAGRDRVRKEYSVEAAMPAYIETLRGAAAAA